MRTADGAKSVVDIVQEHHDEMRSSYHLTLGEAIAFMEKLDDSRPIELVLPDSGEVFLLGNPHSYRGYYSDLAFEYKPASAEDRMTVGEFRSMCKGCVGIPFEGYKGGEFVMKDTTPLWASSCGENSGIAMMSMHILGPRVAILTKQID